MFQTAQPGRTTQAEQPKNSSNLWRRHPTSSASSSTATSRSIRAWAYLQSSSRGVAGESEAGNSGKEELGMASASLGAPHWTHAEAHRSQAILTRTPCTHLVLSCLTAWHQPRRAVHSSTPSLTVCCSHPSADETAAACPAPAATTECRRRSCRHCRCRCRPCCWVQRCCAGCCCRPLRQKTQRPAWQSGRAGIHVARSALAGR